MDNSLLFEVNQTPEYLLHDASQAILTPSVVGHPPCIVLQVLAVLEALSDHKVSFHVLIYFDQLDD